jgi:drug/metabolite transporter (DMT)-like permease
VAKLGLHAAMGVVITIWGVAYTFIARGLQDLSPLGLASVRHVVAVLGFVPLFVLWKDVRRLPEKRDLPRYLFIGVLTVIVYHVALYTGQVDIPPGAAALEVSCVPAMTALLSFAILRERMPPLKVAGLALAFAGVAVVAVLGTPGADARLVGLSVIVLLAPLSTALTTVFGKRLAKKYGGAHVAAWTMLSGTAALLPWGLPLTVGEWAHVTLGGWLAVLYLGLLSTTLAFVLYFHSLKHLQPTEVTVYILLMPIVAVLYAAATVGEPVTGFLVVGGALILGGVATVNLASARAARQAALEAALQEA